MVTTMAVSWWLLIGGLILAVAIHVGLLKVGPSNMKKARGAGLLLAAVGALLVFNIVSIPTGISQSLGLLAVGDAGTTAQPQQVVTSQPVQVVQGGQLSIATMRGQVQEKGSNSYTASGGTLRFYPSGTDPSDPNAVAVDTVTIASGTGTSTAGVLKTGTTYRTVFDGTDTTYYDVDLGELALDPAKLTTNGDYVLTIEGSQAALAMATISDALNENSTALNGQAAGPAGNNISLTTVEIGCTDGCGADSTLTYNDTNGDGSFFIEFTPATTGGNQFTKDFVFCFDTRTTNSTGGDIPEGTEFSAISTQSISGTEWSFPSSVLNHWVRSECINLGSEVKGGASGTTRLTFTVAEANTDANDAWYVRVDDLGKWNAQDLITTGRGASFDTVTVEFAN